MTIEFEPIRGELADILMVPLDQLHDDAELARFDTWDSLSKVTLIALLVDKTGAKIDVDALESADTVGGLRRLVSRRAAEVRP